VQVCKNIRQQQVNTPILFLTALGTTENIVAGLQAGADDYLVKPFKFAELEARMNSIVRRSQMTDKPMQVQYIGDLKLNLTARTVEKNNQPVNLTATEFRLLEYFVKNKNMVLSRLQILETVWGIDFNMGTNVVDVYVNYLRKKIENQTGDKLIQTVVGMGYMLKTG
jgi:DNA-binding response OmpR family regulator